jgi:cobalt-zinc-cadmium efflux system outer membrane protein
MDPSVRNHASRVVTGFLLACCGGGCVGRREPSCLPSIERHAVMPFDQSGGPFLTPEPAAEDSPPMPSTGAIKSPEVERGEIVRDIEQTTHMDDAGAGDELIRTAAPVQLLTEESASQPLGGPTSSARLNVPGDLPGAGAAPIQVPPFTTPDDPERRAALQQIYYQLPPIAGSPAGPKVSDEPMNLAALQDLAMSNSPVLRVAAADAENRRGLAIQAGLYPNPTLGYEGDTINTARTAGYQGGFIEQTIVTGGKLQLARAAAEVEYRNALVALRRAQIDVATAVRSAYFEAIVAREKLRIQTSLATFTEEVFRTQVRLAEAGEAAVYEPLQLRVYVLQARAAVVQAEQRYAAARRQLAAALGLPGMPIGDLVGRPDMPIPAISFEAASTSMLTVHTDLVIARNSVVQAQRQLELARITPLPNIDTYVAVQRDYTFSPGAATVNVQVGAPIPVFNRNTGNIIAAQADLYKAEQSIPQTENRLLAQLADAYSRYESNRRFVQDFQPISLEDQVRTYRGIYERYRNEGQGIQFVDVFVAQQTLSTLLNQYIDLLGAQWQAVVDIAELLQVDDIYTLGEAFPVPTIPELLPPPDGSANEPVAG